MSSHADTIRRHARYVENEQVSVALDALLAENQRYAKALRYIAGCDVAGYEAHLRSEDVAREALAGDGDV